MNMFKKIVTEVFWFVIAIGILGVGWLGYQTLGSNKDIVEAAPIVQSVPAVETSQLTVIKSGIPIRANGFISAARDLEIAAETPGRINMLHPAIQQRGDFKKGDILFQLDDRQTKANLSQLEANLESNKAQYGLVTTQLKRNRTLRERGFVSQDALDQLETRLQEIEASARSIQASIEAAEVSLANTIVRAPFDGRVTEKLAEISAVVGQGTPVARIYATEAIEVEVALRESEASLISNLFNNPSVESHIEADFNGSPYRWKATIDRVEREIDRQTRTINVTLALNNPDEGLPVGHNAESIPALINAFAEVTINTKQNGTVYRAPIYAIRNGNKIWLADGETLIVEKINVLHQESQFAYFTSDASIDGQLLITSQIASAESGMKIDTVSSAANINNVKVQ